MIRKTLVITVGLLALSSVAFAGSCPMVGKQISAALESSTADADTKMKVEALHDEGMSLHGAGKHAESMAKLGEAKALLGMN